ncbi:MAG: excinuclease ABC subunit UvrB [Clostridia bacterium]|nr:excinuclease ABC subunit UvrB [Clostridia bacterium]MBR6299655.1 excinuclease ABC subunit UvrB [Clostridia bacterium]
MNRFVLKAPYQAKGDQPQAIAALAQGFKDGLKAQTLLGVTGSGKTFTMASVIEQVQRPTLVIAHNKTLAAQLCSEFKAFFPDSAVEYFVSYYDYYQPEAYIASSDTYIEKDSSVNDEIDRLRHSATAALQERRDVIIVASVSCIYSMGDPSEYTSQMISLRPGMNFGREALLRKLIDIQYDRNDISFTRGTFRARGDVVEIMPASMADNGIRVEFFGDEIDRISEINPVTGKAVHTLQHAAIYPATHYATNAESREENIKHIEEDLEKQIDMFTAEGKLLEAERIAQRTRYDIEMLREIGFCSGIENYSRYFDGRSPGDPPFSLLDYFPKDFIVFIDESHQTIPQIRAMYAGDRARKTALVEYGFRLPSAFDNRPLRFDEFEERIGQVCFVSATPGPYEAEHTLQTVEQLIRPTGLLDPKISVRPATGQIDDLVSEVKETTARGERVLITTLTKKMAESLTDYLREQEVRVRYLHSDIQTMERMELIRDLRLGAYDVLVGINLLREGLDIPEVSLVAILDADKEGFLRSETSLVQTVGRAARNAEGRVIMYADALTDSMARAINETNRRRAIQEQYNIENGITPQSVKNAVRALLEITDKAEDDARRYGMSDDEKQELMRQLEDQMLAAAGELDFEKAAKLRDKLFELRGQAPADKPQPKHRHRREHLKHGK